MKVVQLVTARQFRGAEMFADLLSTRLSTRGVETLYVALYAAPVADYKPDSRWIDIDGKKSYFIHWGTLRKLHQCLRKFDPDIVQANAGDTLKYAVFARMLFGMRYKIIFRNASVVSRYIKTFPRRVLNYFLYRKVDLVLSVSSVSRLDLTEMFPFV